MHLAKNKLDVGAESERTGEVQLSLNGSMMGLGFVWCPERSRCQYLEALMFLIEFSYIELASQNPHFHYTDVAR